MAGKKKTLYQILGIQRDANSIDIGLGYEKRMAQVQRMVPPDPSAVALVQQAFEILSNPERRAAYDAQLVTAAEKQAAAEQAVPDLEIGEEAPPKRKLPVVPIAIGVAVLVAIALFAWHSSDSHKPAEPVAAKAPPPPPPPPPKTRSAAEVLADVSNASGPLMAYSMSGSARTIGAAVAVEPGAMVTTCHGIPAGSKLVVRVGKDQLPADLTITDERLDLCRLSVAGVGAAPPKLAPDDPKPGERVVLVAPNAKGELAASEGTIKGMHKAPAGNLLEVSMQVPAAASGAGLFDAYGRLIGIATTPHSHGAKLQIALPASWIVQMRSRNAEK